MFNKIVKVSPTSEVLVSAVESTDGDGVEITAWIVDDNGDNSFISNSEFIAMEMPIAVGFVNDFSDGSAKVFLKYSFPEYMKEKEEEVQKVEAKGKSKK